MKNKIDQLLTKTEYSFEDLVSIMEILRSEDGCPWDKEQTHESIRKNMIEETYEVVDAIDNCDVPALREELGDVLLQVVFHSRLEEEKGSFNINDVCDEICKKLIVRHPHIFADVKAGTSSEVLKNWEEIKNQTKGIKKQSESLMAVPSVLPALMRAQKVQGRAAKVDFDFTDAESAMDKVFEEVDELKEALLQNNGDVAEEIGDVLFSVVNVSRHCGIDAEEALFMANEKFIARFKYIEQAAISRGIDIKTAGVKELDKLWDEAKAKE